MVAFSKARAPIADPRTTHARRSNFGSLRYPPLPREESAVGRTMRGQARATRAAKSPESAPRGGQGFDPPFRATPNPDRVRVHGLSPGLSGLPPRSARGGATKQRTRTRTHGQPGLSPGSTRNRAKNKWVEPGLAHPGSSGLPRRPRERSRRASKRARRTRTRAEGYRSDPATRYNALPRDPGDSIAARAPLCFGNPIVPLRDRVRGSGRRVGRYMVRFRLCPPRLDDRVPGLACESGGCRRMDLPPPAVLPRGCGAGAIAAALALSTGMLFRREMTLTMRVTERRSLRSTSASSSGWQA